MSAFQRVMVTGGAGFLGRSVTARLEERGYQNIFVPRSKQYDLTEQARVRRLLDEAKPDLIIHLAGVVGGIGANRANPGKYFYDNAMMGIMLIEEARLHEVSKVLTVGTVCSYPRNAPVPFKEDDIWSGYPEETNAPYGLAKKMLLVQSQAYRQQYGFNAIYLLPVNLYGPGDNFDYESSHVIPALIRKFLEAKLCGAPFVELWGDGSPTREFLYVDDAATGIVQAAERYDGEKPVNLGTGKEIAIRDLAGLIKSIVGFEGEIRWDKEKPNGQLRRRLETSRAKREFDFEARVDLQEGLRRTVAWYLNRQESLAAAR